MNSGVYRFAHALTKAVETIAAVLILLVVLLCIAQVFYRYILFDPLGWTEEVMRYSMIWVTFLGSSALVFRAEHPALEIFSRVESKAVRYAAHYLILVSIGLFCALLLWKGAPVAWDNRNQTSPSAQIPMIYAYLAVPVGSALMLIKVLCLLILPPGSAPRSEDDGPETIA